jgi:hypothetical protein
MSIIMKPSDQGISTDYKYALAGLRLLALTPVALALALSRRLLIHQVSYFSKWRQPPWPTQNLSR